MLIIAHRSGPVHFPEQTVAAARESLSLGADMVEIDVRESLDREVVVSHDPTAERLFGRKEKVAELTANAYAALTHTAAPAYHAHCFRDYTAAGIAPLLLHIKEDTPAFLKKLVEEVNQFGCPEKVIYGVQSLEALRRIKALQQDAVTLAFMHRPEDTAAFASAGADYIRLWEAWASPESLQAICRFGKKPAVMTGNYGYFPTGYTTKERLQAFLQAGAEAILLNDVRCLK